MGHGCPAMGQICPETVNGCPRTGQTCLGWLMPVTKMKAEDGLDGAS
jgi:hypothetical protein